jgi:hypothetical protein
MAPKMSKAQPTTPNLEEFRRFCDQVGSLAQEAGLTEQLLDELLSDDHVRPLPDDLARSMLADASRAVNLDEDIEGHVAL